MLGLGTMQTRRSACASDYIRGRQEEADFYGKNIVLAARIADRARGGEILASSVVKQLTESAGDLHFDNERELELDGLAGTHTVYRVV
jgi:class 3 adenylate cyclase